jgi:hypothetical protein
VSRAKRHPAQTLADLGSVARTQGSARMRPLAAIVAMALLGCTYGPAEEVVHVQNVALRPDGRMLAAIVKYERTQPPTGLTAFPDGGVRRVLEQRADLYLLDLETMSLLFQGGIPAPPEHHVAFSPWLVGWADDRVYFHIRGCAGAPGAECHGALVGTSVFTLSPDSAIVATAAPASVVLKSAVGEAEHFVSAGTESDGVSVGYGRGAPRVPVLRFAGARLEPVRP